MLLVEDIPRVAARSPVVEEEIPPTQESLRNRLSEVQIFSVPGSPQEPEIPIPPEEEDTTSPLAEKDTEDNVRTEGGWYSNRGW